MTHGAKWDARGAKNSALSLPEMSPDDILGLLCKWWTCCTTFDVIVTFHSIEWIKNNKIYEGLFLISGISVRQYFILDIGKWNLFYPGRRAIFAVVFSTLANGFCCTVINDGQWGLLYSGKWSSLYPGCWAIFAVVFWTPTIGFVVPSPLRYGCNLEISWHDLLYLNVLQYI